MSEKNHLTMIGGGYVGLVSGTCLAAFGVHVTIIEQDAGRLTRLKRGEIPIYEPGLDALFAAQIAAGRLAISDNLAQSLAQSRAVFIAVGTPAGRGSGHADLSYVYEAARAIALMAKHDLMVVTKSTVPVGTGRKVADILAQTRPDLSFIVASNPEFLREGQAVRDFMMPDRVVIGLDDHAPEKALAMRIFMEELYQPVPSEKRIFMGLESAELTKYAANAFLAMKVAFINEMADLCEATQADITDITYAMGLDPRISPHFLAPGPGFGGSCFPKDTQALATTASQYGQPSALVEATMTANNRRKHKVATHILHALDIPPHKSIIAILGLTFKANTDDMREAPSLGILPLLHEAGAHLQIFDPQGMDHARPFLPTEHLIYATTSKGALQGADMAVILTEWDEFRALSPQDFLSAMHGKTVFDCRGLYDESTMNKAGLVYHSVGRGRGGKTG